MEGPRSVAHSEFDSLMKFLHDQLRPEANWKVEEEYPSALNLSNINNIRIIREGNRIASHAAIKPLHIKTPNAAWKVAAIGSVVTDPEFRGKGYSSQLIQNCVDEATKQDCDFAILWTNLYEFYEKLGFKLAGQEVAVTINKQIPIEKPNWKFLNSTQISADSLSRLYSQHTVANLRNAEDFRKYLKIPQTQCYTLWNESGSLEAYAIEGKGADLTNYIHEWGGSLPALKEIFARIYQLKNNDFTVIAAQHSQNLIRYFQTENFPQHNGFLGMMKVLNTEKFVNKVKSALRAQGLNNFVFEKRGPEWVFGIKDDLFCVTQESELAQLVFGPWDALPHLSESTQASLREHLPLPLWVWGWDSI